MFEPEGYDTHLVSANMFVRPEFGFEDFGKFWDIYPPRPPSVLSRQEKAKLSKLWVERGKSKIGLLKSMVLSREYRLLLKFQPAF